jgi:hypothetical protein
LPSIDIIVRSRGSRAGEGRDHGLLEGDRTAGDPGRQWQGAAIFRRAPNGALCIAKQNSRTSAILR